MEINTAEWWNEEFKSGRWTTGIDGNEQTKLFAEIAYSLLSPTIKKNVYVTCTHFLDFGCAYGQGLEHFVKKLSSGSIDDVYSGVDFAEAALIEANKKYENFSFHINLDSAIRDTTKGIFDLIYCSNVLEHYKKPNVIFNQLIENSANYIIILVPFMQEINNLHVFKFTKEYLQNLIYLYPEWEIVQMTEIGKIDNLYSPISQILTVYKKIF